MIIIQDRIVSLQIAHLRWKVAVRSLLLVKITRIYKTLPARQSHYLLVAIHFCILVKQPGGWRHNLGGIGFYSSLARHYLPPQYLKFQTKQIDRFAPLLELREAADVHQRKTKNAKRCHSQNLLKNQEARCRLPI